MAIWVPPNNNPFYPLPADYPELSVEGQRKARTNACSLWTVKGRTEKETAEAFAACLRFFDLYYLHADEAIDFNPLFYDDDPLETPIFHYDILKQWASSPRNICIAPRGSAKSFLVRKACLLRMVTRPMYTILYATSTNDNARGTGQALKDQFQHNQRLHDDWNPEFPDNRMVPKRGEAPFGTEMMQLRNGSWLRAISAESRQRGGRPRRYVLDDPEYDPKASTSMNLIRQYMDDLLFKVVLPMVMRAGCGVDWLATFVSRRHYAWHALQTQQTKTGEVVAQDPRFNLWSRMIVRVAYEEDDGSVVSCWPDMWPATREIKNADPRLKDRVSLEEIREIIGTPNFLAEYMARPGEGEGTFFPVLQKETHGWWLEDVDPMMEVDPHRSNTLMCWYSGNELKKKLMCEFLLLNRVFITADTSYTATSDSDFKVACVMSINSENELFILDIWSAQCREDELIKQIMKLADHWKAPTVHIEAIKHGIGVYNTLDSLVRTKAKDMMGIEHIPGIKKLNPGMLEKSAKIASLSLRFEHEKIKFPLWKNDSAFRRLKDQVEQFNPDARDGGLQHDDELDCVSMSQFVIRGRMSTIRKVDLPDKTPLEKLKDGELVDTDTGTYTAHAIDWSKVAASDILDILDRSINDDTKPTRV
jgi:phage terminase large subunit-like protein